MIEHCKPIRILRSAVPLLAALACHAGDLNPPAGPITPTHKTLTEVEPRIEINSTNTPGDADSVFRITQPGSYYLTGNIDVATWGGGGIEVATDRVTIDLMGFSITGNHSLGAGIHSAVAIDSIVVRNGMFRGWRAGGINLSATGRGHIVESIHVKSDLNHSGIIVGVNAQVRACSVTGGQIGIQAAAGSLIEDCTVRSVAFSGAGTGISVADASTVIDCTVTACFNGIIGTNAIIRDCAASNNTNDGIQAGTGCLVTKCIAHGNTQSGIVAATRSTIQECFIRANGGVGIVSNGEQVLIVRNFVDSNPGGGILLNAMRNVVDGNRTCNNAANRGIRAVTAENMIIRNFCSDGFDVPALSFIEAATPTFTAAPFVGTSGGTPLHGNHNWWINFSR